MTGKRFIFVVDNGEDTFYDLSEDGEIMNMIDTEDMLNELHEENKHLLRRNGAMEKENERLKQQLFETSKELLWATSDEVDRALYYEDEVEELRKEIFEFKELYECPHCNCKGLKLMDYGNDKVWECVRCGAELWYCESVEEMKQRCNEIKNGSKENDCE